MAAEPHRYGLLVKLVAAAAAALALASPAAASPRLSPADRAAITRTIDVFVNHAVTREHTVAAYDVVAPEMRPGITRKQWARGDIPVYPFPARGRTHPWNIMYVSRDEAGLELQLMPRPRAKVGPIIFHIYVRPAAHGRWLVDSFMPVATLAPIGAAPRVRALNDFAPRPQSEGMHDAAGRISGDYAFVPFAVIGLVLVGLAGWGVARAIRDRRLFGRRRGTLPPPPGRFSRSP